MNRRRFLKTSIALGTVSSLAVSPTQASQQGATFCDREYWIQSLRQVADPLLHALAEGRLRAVMPVEAPRGNADERRQFTYLEGFGRLLCGIAPWIELGADGTEEGRLRSEYAALARKALHMATDPSSPDHMNFNVGHQPVVDAAFLALAIVRAPTTLWKALDSSTRKNVISSLEASRVIVPSYNNWLLFSAMIETALLALGAKWDPVRVDYALRTVDLWYKGDGVYGDGPSYHWDYYNSFVIHPMLLQILDTVSESSKEWHSLRNSEWRRAARYAAIQERLISPEGTYPPTGRSLCYRFGAFHLLAEVARRHQLSPPVSAGQVRSALTAVMRRMLNAPGTFDSNGWLTLGMYGHQPSLAEPYISTGSAYLCSTCWLPLGLPASDSFWSSPESPWTAKQVWSGGAPAIDHALEDSRCSELHCPNPWA